MARQIEQPASSCPNQVGSHVEGRGPDPVNASTVRGQLLERIRLLIADRDGPRSYQLREKLRCHVHEIQVVGLVQTGDEALDLTGTSAPDIVITDMYALDMHGAELTRAIRQQHPMTSVIFVGDAPSDDELFEAIRCGASAFISHEIGEVDLVRVLKRVKAGTYVIDDNVLANPNVALRVLTAFRESLLTDQRATSLFVPLSPRELEVLEHAARGATNRNIAREMKIGEQTVKNHVGSVMRKLAVNDRTHAVVYALKQGWIKADDL